MAPALAPIEIRLEVVRVERANHAVDAVGAQDEVRIVEFRQIYGLEVLVIPTNVSQMRDDMNDLVYLSGEEKFDAIVADVKDCMASGAPGLGGTASG